MKKQKMVDTIRYVAFIVGITACISFASPVIAAENEVIEINSNTKSGSTSVYLYIDKDAINEKQNEYVSEQEILNEFPAKSYIVSQKSTSTNKQQTKSSFFTWFKTNLVKLISRN